MAARRVSKVSILRNRTEIRQWLSAVNISCVILAVLFVSETSLASESTRVSSKEIISYAITHGLVSFAYWDVGKENLFCIVTTAGRQGADALPKRTLMFLREAHDGYEVLDEFSRGDVLIGMFPSKDVEGKFITVWTSGSAYRFYVFAYDRGRVKQVLEEGSKRMMEILDVNGDGDQEIIVSKDEGGNGANNDPFPQPKETRTYKWVDGSYRLEKSGAWRGRLCEDRITRQGAALPTPLVLTPSVSRQPPIDPVSPTGP